MRTSIVVLLAALSLPVCGQAPVAPRTYALVSAMGSTFTLVRQKKQVGTLLEPYQRHEREVPGSALDAAVLRGLERVVRQSEPDAEVVYLRLDPRELDGVVHYQRGETAIGKLVSAFERMPERKAWHRIVVVTPRYMNSGREGMGEKLHGIGIYVQPAQKLPSNNDELAGRVEDETVSLEGRKGRSTRFVAPYFYAQVWVLDPATLRVLETSQRWDYQKLFDPDSTNGDIEDDFPAERLAVALERFVERATAGALREAVGEVTVSEPRVVTPAAPMR